MAAKFVVLVALVAVAHCSVVPVVQVDADYNSFAYDVADPNTGDYKSQVESRVGGNVVVSILNIILNIDRKIFINIILTKRRPLLDVGIPQSSPICPRP
ncbi:unnamed protein product [Arctia plantaginis]|uniref:Uncharacterized protein n=1 Tax=Arctia plantaginis TaxID=874455 RepID=A0A8S1ALN8_ARCPL|nr:unnamed protein product [Arctia plantaginis]